MAVRPFAPWGIGTAVADDRPWEVREFASIYRGLGQMGYLIRDVDELYVYEVAGLFAIGEPGEEREDPALAGLSPGARRAIERMRAESEGRPPPVPQGPNDSIASLMSYGAG